MRTKWVLLISLLALALVFSIAAGEGDRKYSNFWAQTVGPGVQTTVTNKFGTCWRYNIVTSVTNAAADSIWVKLTFADGDTTLLRYLPTYSVSQPIPVAFYGPDVNSFQVKVWAPLVG